MWRFVSMTPLSHCISKQLLVNHINCKDITDYTQSYHSRKATRQPTHFYNSKGTVGGEWNLTQHIGRVEYNEHGHRAGGQTRSKTEVIVGPRPPLIQLSTDIRGSWIKGGSRVIIPFVPKLCNHTIQIQLTNPHTIITIYSGTNLAQRGGSRVIIPFVPVLFRNRPFF